jgi:hypothetical protein
MSFCGVNTGQLAVQAAQSIIPAAPLQVPERQSGHAALAQPFAKAVPEIGAYVESIRIATHNMRATQAALLQNPFMTLANSPSSDVPITNLRSPLSPQHHNLRRLRLMQ